VRALLLRDQGEAQAWPVRPLAEGELPGHLMARRAALYGAFEQCFGGRRVDIQRLRQIRHACAFRLSWGVSASAGCQNPRVASTCQGKNLFVDRWEIGAA